MIARKSSEKRKIKCQKEIKNSNQDTKDTTMEHNMKEKTLKWEILNTEYLIREPWLTARRDKVKLPTGVVVDDYYVLEYPTWVNVIAITKDGHFVFVRQYRHGLGVISTEICAGVAEKGEEPLEAAKRELLEETGYGNGTWQHWMTVSPNPGTTNNLCHCFLATDVEKIDKQHLDKTEDIEVLLLTQDDMMELLEKNGLYQAMMYAPLWKWVAKNKR